MDLYRVKQFYLSISAKINPEDIEFIDRYLNNQEKSLFKKLSIYEQKHSINVAKSVNAAGLKAGMDVELLTKAALLHDIGKINQHLNIINKSLLVLADNVSKGRMKRFKGIKNINLYYFHGDTGYSLLKKLNYDERLLYLIKNHHNENIIGDKELDLLRAADNKF